MLPAEATGQYAGEGEECFVTVREKDFVAKLRPGDVLLFDSAFAASALIKFADNSTVNHCALYIGEDHFAHVTHHLKGEPTVQPVPIYARLAEKCDYSVTALRYDPGREPGGSEAATFAVANSARIGDKAEEYAYLSLLALIFPAFVRSYGSTARGVRLLAPGLDVLSRSFLRSMGEEAVTQDFSSELGGRKSLTCSEFVYRCFTEFSSPYAIEVVNPLCRWKRPKRLRSGGQDTDLGADLFALELNPAFSAVLDIEEPAARVLRGDPSLSSAVQGASVRLIKNLCRYNLQKDHTKPPESGVVASFVTPVDLWSSPSFSARTVLVRSPGEVKPALAHHGPGVGP